MKKEGIAGRPKKEVNKLKERVFGFRLSTEEEVEFERILKLSGVKNKTDFIKGCVFNQTIKVVKIDKAAIDYYKELVNLQAQYKAIGNNYNQTVKAINATFSEKKALAFLFILRDVTVEFAKTNKEIIQLTKNLEQWLQK